MLPAHARRVVARLSVWMARDTHPTGCHPLRDRGGYVAAEAARLYGAPPQHSGHWRAAPAPSTALDAACAGFRATRLVHGILGCHARARRSRRQSSRYGYRDVRCHRSAGAQGISRWTSHRVSTTPRAVAGASEGVPRYNDSLNLTGALRWRLARKAREPHRVGSAARLTPAR